MIQRIFVLLVIAYCSYSFLVYTAGTKNAEKPKPEALAGFSIWQSKNCQACHQIYGLGGYMGPDLTNIISDSAKGPLFAKGLILSGSAKMPNFHFTETEADKLVAFLTWVDKSGRSMVPANKVNRWGNYHLDKN